MEGSAPRYKQPFRQLCQAISLKIERKSFSSLPIQSLKAPSAVEWIRNECFRRLQSQLSLNIVSAFEFRHDAEDCRGHWVRLLKADLAEGVPKRIRDGSSVAGDEVGNRA